MPVEEAYLSLGGGKILDVFGNGPVAAPDPVVVFNQVFGNNILTPEKQANNTVFTATVLNYSGEPYSFDLFNVSSGGTAVQGRGGTVSGDSAVISATFTAAELALITNQQGRVDLVFPNAGETFSVPFVFENNLPPEAPVILDTIVNATSVTIPYTRLVSPGETYAATVEETGLPATRISVIASSTGVSIAEGYLADGKTYLVTITVTDSQGLSSSDTATITVSLASTVQSKITSPLGQTTGTTATFNWSAPVPAAPFHHIQFCSDLNDLDGSVFHEATFAATTSYIMNSLPTDGSGYHVRLWDLPADGNGQPDYNNGTFSVTSYQASAAPDISAPAAGTNISTGTTLQWNVTGQAAGDSYNFRVFTGRLGPSDVPDFEQSSAATSANVTGLPTDGSPVHVMLDTVIGSTTVPALYHFVSGDTGGVTHPTMVGLAPNATVTTATLALNWNNNGLTINNFVIRAGDTLGGNNFYDSGVINNGSLTSDTISGYPLDGSPVYVSVNYQVPGGTWYNVVTCILTGTASTQNRADLTAPGVSGGIAGGTVNFIWAESGVFVADTWRIKIGATSGGDEILNADVAIGNFQQALPAIGGDPGDVYVGLYSVTSSVETLHDERLYTATTVVQAAHRYHNGIGTPTTQSFTRFSAGELDSKGMMDVGDQANVTISQRIIDGVSNQLPVFGDGCIKAYRAHNLTITECILKCPDAWFINNPIGAGIFLRNCNGARISKVNIYGGNTGIRLDTCGDWLIEDVMFINPYRHHCHISKTRLSNGARGTLRRFYGYTARQPSISGGSTDGINFAQNILDGNTAVRITCEDGLIEGGSGGNSSALVTEGPDFGPNRSGRVDVRNFVGFDNCNKFIANTGGSENTFTDCYGFQDDLTYGLYSNGNISGYDADYYNLNNNPSNGKDIDFGKTIYTRCKTHWWVQGRGETTPRVGGFAAPRTGTGFFQVFAHTPVGNEPTFNDCTFDADSPQGGSPSSTWSTPAVQRGPRRRWIADRIVSIPNYYEYDEGFTMFLDKVVD